MNKINKQALINIIIIFVALLITLPGFAVSCALFNNNPAEETSQTQETTGISEQTVEEDKTEEITEISIWTKLEPDEQIELTNSIDTFGKEDSAIKITTRNFRSYEELLDQFTAASLAGAGADIIISELESLKSLAQSGVIKPLSEDMVRTDILAGCLEISSFGGSIYALPFRAYDFLMLFYNREYIEDPPASFVEMIEYCKQVNIPDQNIWGFLFNWKEPEWILPFCGGYQDWVYDYDTNSIFLDTLAMTKSLQFLYDIYNIEKILPFEVEYDDINNAFTNKTAHMVINGNWAVEEYDKAGLDFGVSKIPVVLGGFKNPTPMINGTGFMFNVNSYGEEFEASKKFVSYLLSEEIQLIWTERTQTLPVLKTLAENPQVSSNQVLLNQIKQAEICRGKIPEEVLRIIIDSVRINTENVLYGNISPEDAVKKMQEDAIMLKEDTGVSIETTEASE